MRSTVIAFALVLTASAFAPGRAHAADCFILVHGNRSTDTSLNPSDVVNYWPDFADSVTGGTANYAYVYWNSKNADAIPFWHPDAAGAVASQLIDITDGDTDGISHARQCASTDTFYIVAHSQGAQVLTYMNGNAYSGAPNLDTVIDAMDLGDIGTADEYYAPFSTALGRVTAIFTVGGAINGTEGMDDVCDGGWDSWFAGLFGATCVPSLQTFTSYNPSSFTGSTLYRPMYAIGGYANGITSPMLTGEDDTIVNLASQMNCAGSATRDLEDDLTERNFWNSILFRCNRYYKRHTSNSFNMASIDIDHDEEREGLGGSWTHTMGAEDVLSCGNGLDVPETIAACMSSVP
jgi:hypothetical protein